MTATTPQPMEGSQAPSQIEFLYERYRPVLKWLLVLFVAGFATFYGLRWQRQNEINETWSGFAATIGLEDTYSSKEAVGKALADYLGERDLAALEQALATADDARAPFLLLVIARKAMLDQNWERAESALDQLESRFPQHSLVIETAYPVQVREDADKDEDEDEKPAPRPNKPPELKPAQAGSVVGLMREQIARSKDYTSPAQFAKPEIPDDAKKVKFELSGDFGSFTIALMPQAPVHAEKFLELATAEDGPFWQGINVDEIQRSGSGYWANSPMQFHLGFTTTKDQPERAKWTKTDPSEYEIEFEETGLSHFPGAVAARIEADGKSCADRFYVCGEDDAARDGTRVVFGYVVDGMENVIKVCEAAMMTAQEEEIGRGVPADNITVESVTVLE